MKSLDESIGGLLKNCKRKDECHLRHICIKCSMISVQISFVSSWSLAYSLLGIRIL